MTYTDPPCHEPTFLSPEEKADVEAWAHAGLELEALVYRLRRTSANYSRWLRIKRATRDLTLPLVTRTSPPRRQPASVVIRIQVVCIHCASGLVFGDPVSQFTVADVRTSMSHLRDNLVLGQLRKSCRENGGCLFRESLPGLRAEQDDMYLHSEPDEPFFDIPSAAPAQSSLRARGSIELSGDEHFQWGKRVELMEVTPRVRGNSNTATIWATVAASTGDSDAATSLRGAGFSATGMLAGHR